MGCLFCDEEILIGKKGIYEVGVSCINVVMMWIMQRLLLFEHLIEDFGLRARLFISVTTCFVIKSL